MEHIGSARILLQAQRFPNLIDDFLWRTGNVDRQRVLWLLQVGQLAGKDCFPSKMSMAFPQALGN